MFFLSRETILEQEVMWLEVSQVSLKLDPGQQKHLYIILQ